MRLLGYALALLVCLFAVGGAAPKGKAKAKAPKAPAAAPAPKPPAEKQPSKAEQEELAKLDKEMQGHQLKSAWFAAAKTARKAYELQKKATGDDSQQAVYRKEMLASMVQAGGDYAGAEKLFLELLKTAEKTKGVESREALNALSRLSGPYWAQSRFEDLEPTLKRIVALTKKLDGEKSIMYPLQLNSYAAMLNMRNEYSAALRVYEEVLAIHESMAPSKDDISLVSPVQTLAGVYLATNQHAKAIALYDRVLAISDKKAPDAMSKVTTLMIVGNQYFYGSRKDLATPIFKRAIALGEVEIARLEKTDPDGYQYPMLLGQLGSMYQQVKDLANAEKAFTKANAIATKKNTISGYEYTLAEVKREQNKPREALAILEQAQATMIKLAPTQTTAYATPMADVLTDLGEYKRAEKLLDEVRVTMTKQWGKNSPYLGHIVMSSVKVYAASGKLAQAEKALDEALDIAERDLASVLRSGTDSDHAVYFSKNAYLLDMAINFHLKSAPASRGAAQIGMTTLLRRKGRVLDAAAASLATIRSRLSPDDKKLLDELNSARAQLAKLTVAGPSATAGADFAKEVAALEERVQRLELQISKKSAAYRTVTQPIELASVQKAIPADARLVEIVNYQPYDPKATYIQQRLALAKTPRHYAAYVMGSKGDPVLVELGPASAIDQAIEAFRKAVADPDNDRAVDLGKALYDLTLAKVVPKLGGATNIFIAPDGALNVVPFSALSDDKKNFLIKTYTFTYLTSGRDLLRVTAKTKAQGGGVIFADPTFDTTKKAAPAGDNKTRGRRSADLASLKWPQLPGTGQEADALIKTMKGLKVYRGDLATEGTLKAMRAPKILHLATHGFFLPDEPPANTNAATAPAAPAAATPAATTVVENPLLRSGLAFAGANQLSSGDDDGILTALEASGLDLSGTKLVVLSACETGVGKVTNGDGVYGLRRALVIAGAESLVMTLWQVDDFATKELMAGFYKKLAAGKPRSDSLREIQLEILAREKYAHPFYWASFLPAGATSSLKD